MKKFVLIFLAACSYQVEAPSKVDDGGPSYIDSTPATLPYKVDAWAPETSIPLPPPRHVPKCWSYDTCGGDWRGFTCPADYTPPPESHCVRGPQGEQTDPVWCCYGTVNP